MLARFERAIQDGAGNILPGAQVTVRREATGAPLATLKPNRDGSGSMLNPVTADADGYIAFHAAGGAYRLDIVAPGFTRTLRYVRIGIGGETDIAGAFNIRDQLAAPANLPATANPGDAYLIPDDSSPPLLEVWVWLTDDEQFVNVGAVVGVPGPEGDPSTVPGPQGDPGLSPGYAFTFSSSTTTNADPGAGVIRLNNAALASVTQIAIDDQSSRLGNPSVVAAIAAWGGSTNPSAKGTLRLTKFSAPQNFAEYALTGITDQSGYTQLAVTHVASSGSFSNGDVLAVEFVRAGDKGADGLGTGDVVGPAGATDDHIAVFDGITGKLLKGGGTTIAALTASILSTVRAGVDAAFDTLAELAAAIAGKEPADADIVKSDVSANLTKGYTATSVNLGTVTTGTTTLDPTNGNLVRYVNGGAHTLAPPSSGEATMVVQITNTSGAGAITTSGFTKKTGDAFTTTNGDDFLCFVSRVNGFTHLHVVALQ